MSENPQELAGRVVARCLEEFQRVGDAAVERACQEHPDLEDTIRAAVGGMRVLREAASDVSPHTTLGRYQILEEIGRGGMGRVLRAHDPQLQRTVALKVLPSALALSSTSLERFRREGQSLARSQHPHIVPVFDVGETEDGLPYLAMKFIEGRSLQSILDAPPGPDVESSVRLIRKIADALEHAHQVGIIHRDVKPANILIDADGEPCLVDFGIARDAQATGITQEGTRPGTPVYMAPEQIEEADLDPRTDVYALGATLYHCITQRRPFEAQTTHQLFDRIRHKDPILPRRIVAEIPADLETICLTAMEKDPDRRYQSAAELRDDLERFLQYRPVVARPLGRAARLARAVRRNPTRAALVTLSVALFVGGPTTFALLEMSATSRVNEEKRKTQRNFEAAQLANARSSFILAGQAAQRGRWQAARNFYDEAERLGYEDRVAIDIGRIEAWEGSLDTLRAMQVLNKLKTRSDIGRHRAKLLLLEADLGVNRLVDPDARLDQVREALELGELAPADAEFARAMLADSVTEALRHAEAARNHDPYHRRVNDLTANLLVMAGRLQDGLRFAGVMRSLYPDDPNPVVYAAFLHALSGNRERALELARHARTLLPAGEHEFLSVGIETAGMIGEFDEVLLDAAMSTKSKVNAKSAASMLNLVRKAWPAFVKKRKAPADEKQPGKLYFRIAPVAMRSLRDLLRSGLASQIPFASKKRVLQDLAIAADKLGDGMYHFLRGYTLANQRRYADAEPCFVKAAAAPSIALSPKTAWFWAAGCLTNLLHAAGPNSEAARPLQKKLRVAIGALLDLGSLNGHQLNTLHRFAIYAKHWDLAIEVAERWYRKMPQDAGAKKAHRLIPAILQRKRQDNGR